MHRTYGRISHTAASRHLCGCISSKTIGLAISHYNPVNCRGFSICPALHSLTHTHTLYFCLFLSLSLVHSLLFSACVRWHCSCQHRYSHAHSHTNTETCSAMSARVANSNRATVDESALIFDILFASLCMCVFQCLVSVPLHLHRKNRRVFRFKISRGETHA